MVLKPAHIAPIFQMAYVVDDFASTLRYWTEIMGVGPFFQYPHIGIDQSFFRGGPPTSLDISVSIGYWQDMQIELIELHDDNPSTYREHLEKGGAGFLHHVAIHPANKWEAAGMIEQAGGQRVQELWLGPARALYYELPGPGPIVELAEIPPSYASDFATMREAARDWDGRDPLRLSPSVARS